MALNPAIADAYRKVVVTTGTGGGGIPGTTTSQEVGGELNLDAGFGISLVTDVLNNKVTIVNTGNGTGALTTITENNKNGVYYPIFTRSPPGTQTFTVAASDFTSGDVTSGLAEIRITGSSNSPTAVSAQLRASITGLIPGETFSLIKVSDGATMNFTVAEAPLGHYSGEYDTVLGCWRIYITAAPGSTETFVSITIATGTGEMNPLTGTYQMDTMYLDQTTTPMTYNPATGALTVTSVNGNVNTTALLVGASADFTRFPGALAAISNTALGIQQNESLNIGLIAEATGNGATYAAGLYGVGYTSVGARGTGVIGEGHVSASTDSASAIGVRGYSNDTHASGLNVGLYADASGSSIGNYALYINSGDINTTNVSPIWLLRDNQATALSLDATGKTGIIVVKTTDGSEGVTMSGTLGVTGATTLSSTLSVTGHVTIEGVTSTGATGTGKFVFDNAPTISGHPTIEGVTSTGATGTGKFVFDGSPTLVTPTLGVATATSINKMAITAPTTSSTLAVEDGKTFTVKKTITLDGTDSTTITLPATTGTVALDNQSFYVGTTSLTINRSSASQSLTGITSIDGYAAGLAGGNGTTLLGSFPYQSAANTTSLLSPNTTTTRKFVRMTGDGTNGAAPAWDTVTQTDVGLSNVTNESKATMFTDPTFTGTVSLAPATFESVSVSATSATGTVNVDPKTNTVFYYTSAAGANWTFNFRGDGSTSLNSYLSTGKSVTVAFMVTQGVTAYYPTAFTVDSTASGVGGYVYSVKWLGAAAPTGGNASSIDSYTFTIIKTADKAFTIIASQARFA